MAKLLIMKNALLKLAENMILQPNKFSVLENIGIRLVGQTEKKQSKSQRKSKKCGEFFKTAYKGSSNQNRSNGDPK